MPSASAKACELTFAGITVKAGKAWDTVTATCDAEHRPQRHLLQAWIEYKRFDDVDSSDCAGEDSVAMNASNVNWLWVA